MSTIVDARTDPRERERERERHAPVARPDRRVLHPTDLCDPLRVDPLPPQRAHEQDARARDRDRVAAREDAIVDGALPRRGARALQRDREREVVAQARDETVEVGRGGAVGRVRVEQLVDLLEGGGDFLRRGRRLSPAQERGSTTSERTFFETLVRATISLKVRATRPCLHAIKMHAAMMAASLLPLRTFSSSTRLNSILLVSMIDFGKLMASHMVAIWRNAPWRSRPDPPWASLATREAAICSARATPVLLSLNEMTVLSWSAASRRGSAGPPTRDGSSPSESAKERPERRRASARV